MDSLDRQVLEQAREWFLAGRKVWIVTVIETWGSAPRPPGALLAMRDDGLVAGSVSGGCVEDDLIEVVRGFAHGPAVLVGHSVSAMIGLLAGIKAPELFAAHMMIGPSPCYINDGDYVGGFSAADIESLLETMESNYLGWSSTMAPAIMGAPEQPALAEELTNSFCRTDPDIAAHFARVTFLSDNRADVPRLQAPVLVLQCSEDLIAPRPVGEFLARTLPDATLRIIDNVGHCPHLSAPSQSMAAMDEFMATLAGPGGRGLA